MSSFNDIKELNATFLLIRYDGEESYVEAYDKQRILLEAYKKSAQNDFAPISKEDYAPYFTQPELTLG